MVDTVDALREKIEAQATDLHQLLEFASRAFVIEFSGTPKAGKSTSVEAIRHFFSRFGFRVHVLAERAAVCPIPMKGHLFFNTWCASSMLAELLANVEANSDLIILDRGLFDSLVWLTLQGRRGELTPEETKTIESFFLLERWRSLIDLAVVMNVDAAEAIARENSQRITNRVGSIMNAEVLAAVSESVKDTIDKYGRYFPKIIEVETTGQKVTDSNLKLADQILHVLGDFLNPEILVVPRAELEKLPGGDSGSFTKVDADAAVSCIKQHAKFVRRKDAESDKTLVQLVSAGLLTNNDQVFVFYRNQDDPKSDLYGKNTILQACHIEKRTTSINVNVDFFKNAIIARFARSLFLSRAFKTELVGYCWDRNNEKSNLHFGIVFRMNIDNPHTAVDLKKKEFRRGRGHGIAGSFVSWDELISKSSGLDLEPWSKAILDRNEVVRGNRD